MSTPSPLTDAQWAEIGERLLKGEDSMRALAREYGTSEASVRRRFPSRRKDVKDVANQLLEAEQALKRLPRSSQIDALNLLDELKAISSHLASAARLGAATAHKAAYMAHSKIEEIDETAPLDDEAVATLKGVAVLTRMANEASEIGMNIIKANKEAMDKSAANADKPLREYTDEELQKLLESDLGE